MAHQQLHAAVTHDVAQCSVALRSRLDSALIWKRGSGATTPSDIFGYARWLFGEASETSMLEVSMEVADLSKGAWEKVIC